MKLLLFLSEVTIPLLIFCIVGYGILSKQSVYEDFLDGAKDGFQTVVKIMPTLVGLMVARLRTFGLRCHSLGTVDRKSGIPGRAFSGYHCENVFFLGSDRAAVRYLQRVWRRFHIRENGIDHDEQYGNYFLYDVGLFHVGKGEENALYARRCFACDGGRNDCECGDRRICSMKIHRI